MTHYTLGTAANACGLNKSTVLRAIKAGKISATRDAHGQWQIDPAEMHRVYPPIASNPEEQRSEQRYAPVEHRDRTDELVAELRARLDDMRNERDRARTASLRNARSPPQATSRKPRKQPLQRLTSNLQSVPSPSCHSPTLSRHDCAARGDGCGRRGALRARACCSPYRPCPRVLNSSSRNNSRRRDASRLR
jgi:hypothetical protein